MKKMAGYTLFVSMVISIALSLTSCINTRSSSNSEEYDYLSKALKDTVSSMIYGFSGDSDIPENAIIQEYEPETASMLQKSASNFGISNVEIPEDAFSDVSISFIAAGDNLIHPNLYTDAAYRGTSEKKHDFLPLYENVAPLISAADFAFINQETVMAGDDAYGLSGWPTFNSPQQLGRDLVDIGFDIVSMANNHMLDKGASGYSSTLDFWHSQPVTLIGGYYNSSDASNIRTIEADGITIALLAYTYGTNGISLPAGSELVVPYIDDSLIISNLSVAKEIADFIIVSIHWGLENTQEITDEQIRLAQLIADNGADVILGSHSHTLQPLTWLKSSGGKDVLCIYSLGNFVSGMSNSVNMVGGLLSFDIAGNTSEGLKAENVLFTPTVTYYGMDWYNTHIYLLEEYTDTIAASHGIQINGGYLSVESAKKYVTNVIPSEFLPDYLK